MAALTMQEKYHLVLMESEMGREVLGDILQLCNFGCTLNPENPAQTAEHNIGVTILSQCGVFGKGTLPQVLNAFTAVMPEQEEVP